MKKTLSDKPSASGKPAAKKATARKAPAKKAAATRKPAAAKKPAAARKPRAPRKPKVSPDPILALLRRVRSTLDAKKGEAIRVLDVRGLSDVTDFMILCSGISAPHLRALAEAVARELRAGDPPLAPHRTAGSTESGWIILDCYRFVVHLFSPEMRAYYALERLWKDAPEA